MLNVFYPIEKFLVWVEGGVDTDTAFFTGSRGLGRGTWVLVRTNGGCLAGDLLRQACLFGHRDPVLLAVLGLFCREEIDFAGDEDLRFDVELLLELLLSPP